MVDLDRPQDRMGDLDARIRVVELQARLGRAARIAVRPDLPTGYQGAVANPQVRYAALDVDAAPGDQQAVERDAAAAVIGAPGVERLADHRQGVRLITPQ